MYIVYSVLCVWCVSTITANTSCGDTPSLSVFFGMTNSHIQKSVSNDLKSKSLWGGMPPDLTRRHVCHFYHADKKILGITLPFVSVIGVERLVFRSGTSTVHVCTCTWYGQLCCTQV